MPDESGRIRPISVPACPWHELDTDDEQHELERDNTAEFMHSVSRIRRTVKRERGTG